MMITAVVTIYDLTKKRLNLFRNTNWTNNPKLLLKLGFLRFRIFAMLYLRNYYLVTLESTELCKMKPSCFKYHQFTLMVVMFICWQEMIWADLVNYPKVVSSSMPWLVARLG